MSQKIKKIIVLSFVLIISIVFTRCQKDDDLSNPESNQISLAKNWFKEYESSSDNYALLQNLNYDWNEANITKSEDGTETIIVPVIELKKDEREIWSQKLYIYKLEAGKYKALVFETYSNRNVELKSQTIEGGNFTGYMTVWDLKEGFVRAAKFVNNHVVEEGIAEFSNNKNMTGKAPADPPCIYADFGDGGCGGLSGGDSTGIALRPVIIIGSNTGIQLAPVIIIAPSKGTPVIYNPRGPVIGGTTPGGFTSPTGGGSGTPGSGITAPTPVQITDMLIGKAKCLNALLNKSGNSFVQKLLAKFQGSSEFDIQISSVDKVYSKDGKSELNGKTEHIKGSSEMNIQISISRANDNSALETARIVLHEYIHADIFRKTYTTQDAKSKEVIDFKTTYDAYVTEKDHAAMATLYISSMKEALKDFHKNILTADYNKYIEFYDEAPSDAFYEALAWGGLKDSNIKPWADLSLAKKAEINDLAGRVKSFSKEVPCPQ